MYVPTEIEQIPSKIQVWNIICNIPPREPSIRSACREHLPHILEREGSLRCSLELIDGRYCGPDESNPRFCIHIVTGDVVRDQKSCSYLDLPLKDFFIHFLHLTHTQI